MFQINRYYLPTYKYIQFVVKRQINFHFVKNIFEKIFKILIIVDKIAMSEGLDADFFVMLACGTKIFCKFVRFILENIEHTKHKIRI